MRRFPGTSPAEPGCPLSQYCHIPGIPFGREAAIMWPDNMTATKMVPVTMTPVEALAQRTCKMNSPRINPQELSSRKLWQLAEMPAEQDISDEELTAVIEELAKRRQDLDRLEALIQPGKGPAR